MLARLARALPAGDYLYEPKWDGFRCLAFRDGSDVDLRSRHDRPLARYFPEVVEAISAIPVDAVLDGELTLVSTSTAAFDFATLMSRLHPAASRVERLRREHPATYVAFDLLAIGTEDLTERPFAERRERLELLVEHPPAGFAVTPATRDPVTAQRWLDGARDGGIDGVVAKPLDGRYEPGRRSMLKVKRERTADVVVAGVRPLPGGAVSSLLLGLYDESDDLRHVGVVTQIPKAMRMELAEQLRPLVIPLERHPWRDGFHIGASPLGRLKGSAARWTPDMEPDWVPLRPERVAEVRYDQVDVDRFRHPARFLRWRPDRDPRSCRLEQILPEAPALLTAVAPAAR